MQSVFLKKILFKGGKVMNKEESLSFLQSCIDKVNCATEQDINLFQKNYGLKCAIPS